MKKIIILSLVFLGYVATAYSQHEHHEPPKKEPAKTTQKKNTTKKTSSKRKAVSQTKNTQITSKQDTDIVVLLNTPGFLKSEWTTKELAKANAMMIGILQLIWPNHKQERDAELSIPFQLYDTHFGNNNFTNSNSYLTNDAIEKIVQQAESLRARSLAARQDNIVTEFISAAKKTGVPVALHPEKIIITTKFSGQNYVMIPTVGVPQAFRYNQAEDVVKKIAAIKDPQICLIYDHINIRNNWLEHLDWLDKHLPIKAIKIFDAEKWLKKP